MKLVACALTLLLALGCQARAMQSDAPSQLEKMKDTAMVYLAQVKESAQRTLDHLDGTEYAEYKMKLSQSMDKLSEFAQTLTPYGDTFSVQFLDTTNQVRQRVMTDIEDLRLRLEPKREELHQLLQKQLDEYRTKMEPIFQEYMTQNQEKMDALKARLQPMMEEMRTKMEANVAETKTKVMPMIETARTKLTERLEELKTMATPYMEEYQEQLNKAVGDAKDKIAPHTQDLQSKLEPYMEDLKAKFMSVYQTISQVMTA